MMYTQKMRIIQILGENIPLLLVTAVGSDPHLSKNQFNINIEQWSDIEYWNYAYYENF